MRNNGKIPKFFFSEKKAPRSKEEELKRIDKDLRFAWHTKVKKWAVIQNKQGLEKIVNFYDDLDYAIKDIRRLHFIRETFDINKWYREMLDAIEHQERSIDEYLEKVGEEIVKRGLYQGREGYLRDILYFDMGAK